MIKHKKCNCDKEHWQETVVQQDEHYGNKNVIYYYCQECDTDFRVEDLETRGEVFYNDYNYNFEIESLNFSIQQSLN